MPEMSKSELSRLLGDDDLGEQAYRLDILSRWPSLRVLDFLFTEGRSTTGEIARGVNMDMREIRETVESLAEVEILEKVQDNDTSYWVPTSHRFLITFEDHAGLELNLKSETVESVNCEPTNSTGSQRGLFEKIGAKIDAIIG